MKRGMILAAFMVAATPTWAQTGAPVTTASPEEAPAATVANGNSLVGLDGETVRARLGEPHVARAEGAGALWTYRRAGCTLLVFFQQGSDRVHRVTGAEAGAREVGGAPPPLETCLASPAEAR